MTEATRRPARAWLGLGGNIGEPREAIAAALARLPAHGVTVVRRSSDWLTPPWGKTDQPAYVNACAEVETDLDPHGLLAACLAVERYLGRIRLEKWGPRVIDIDLLAYEDRRIDSPDLVVPHRYMLERAFVLVPLAEIAPDLVIAGTAVREHVRRFDTAGIVRLP